MRSGGAVEVGNDRIRAYAERVVTRELGRDALALSFEESTATSAEVLVEGQSFYPRILEDVASATSSVHINQFGFRPGVVGDEFAEALLAKAAEGVPVRLVVDTQGSDPEGSTATFYERLSSGGIEICVVRATKPRAASGPLGRGGPTRWNVSGLGHIDHRKFVVVDGRTGWVGGAGIEDHFQDGRFHDLFVRVTGPVVAQLQLVFLASFRWLGGLVPNEELDALFPSLDAGEVPARVLHNAPGRFRPITQAIARSFESARETLDVVNPYVTDRGMIRRVEDAARRGVRVRLFVPANANNWACAAAQQFHHATCSTPASASSSTRRCCTQRRSSATARSCSSAPATSRRGASSGSSRSTSSSPRRRSPPSSTSGSARPRRRSRLPGERSKEQRSVHGAPSSPPSRRFSDGAAVGARHAPAVPVMIGPVTGVEAE